MIVKYRCNGCPIDGNVDVPPRGNMDILKWMETVIQLVSNHHLEITGENHGTCDIAIPIEANQPIGVASDEIVSRARDTAFPEGDQ
jgi:hypothetical protein